MKVDLFDFDLPSRHIAQKPAEPRDSARLLDLSGDAFHDRRVSDLPDILNPGDLLVGNDTRVIPARLTGRRGTAKVELTLHKSIGPDRWLAFAKPARKLKPGDTVVFAGGFSAVVREKHDGGEVVLRFDRSDGDLLCALDRHGRTPLPPYIKRPSGDLSFDRDRYQTVYARSQGAVAAPTAGLHFTESLLATLEEKGIGFVALTLHVGAGTFLPVKVDDTRDHRMHSEWGRIDVQTADRINRTRSSGKRVVAIGTTVLRLLETATDGNNEIRPFSGETDIFITPGHRFASADFLLTNFHLPRSTLFMLVSAFAGLEKMREAYEHAKSMNYRFYSYGDCCLLKCVDGPGANS